MHQDLSLVLTLAGGLTAALFFGSITQRLRLSPIVGYLIAGCVVGPFTPGFVADRHAAEQLAEIGVVLLMFGVGVHFHAKDLLAVRKIAIPGALVQIGIATALGVLVTWTFGWSLAAGAVFGIAISVASTVVLVRVLSDHDALHTPSGHVAVGWLLVEDLFTVLVLVLLPVLARGGPPLDITVSAGIALLKVGALVAFTWLVGRRAIPALLRWIAATRSRELFTLAVLVIALGIAVGSAQVFGVSMALGAFLAGMVVGQSEFSARAASEALPMRDAFAVLFFVAMGMLLDPSMLAANLALTASTMAVILVGKPLAALAVGLLLRYPPHTTVPVAIALAQIGEFSFIVGHVGLDLRLLPEPAMQALVASSILSITLNPFLFRLVAPLSRKLAKHVPPREIRPPSESEAENRAIVVGYGPVGRTLVRLLREEGIEPTVIELNDETVRRLVRDGVPAIYGDASQAEVLERAGIRSAMSLVFAASGSAATVVAAARLLRPELPVIARTTYIAEIDALRRTGARTVVVTAEAEVALAMTEQMLSLLGATPEQLDRARDRVYEELAADRPLGSETARARPTPT